MMLLTVKKFEFENQIRNDESVCLSITIINT